MHDLLRTERYEVLRDIIKEARGDLSQKKIAARIRRPQTYISDIETGVRRIDTIEFLRLAKALKLDPVKTIAKINRVKDKY